MDRRDIGHRFANQDFGKNGHLKAGNVSVDGRNYYSYSTVFAQWLDQEKKVVVVYNGSTSSSSSKHQLWKGIFPGDHERTSAQMLDVFNSVEPLEFEDRTPLKIFHMLN